MPKRKGKGCLPDPGNGSNHDKEHGPSEGSSFKPPEPKKQCKGRNAEAAKNQAKLVADKVEHLEESKKPAPAPTCGQIPCWNTERWFVLNGQGDGIACEFGPC